MKHTLVHKTLHFKQTGVDEVNHIIRGVFSTAAEDRQGEVVDQKSWILDEFLANPVILFAHDHCQPAVAKCVELVNDMQNGLTGAIQFAYDEYDFAATLFNLYAGGYMRAFSVGFMNGTYEIDQQNDVVTLKDNTLYEISCVNVPANAMALAYSKGIDTSPIERVVRERNRKDKAVVPYHDYGMADEGMAWDGPGQVAACGDDLTKLKDICAWYDAENPDVKGSYKLPHHLAENKEAVWRGVAAAMGALLGSQGGVDLPEGDRQGVYNHLAKHYAQFGKEVPEMKSYTPEELDQISEHGVLFTEAKEEKSSHSNIHTIIRAIASLERVVEARKADTKEGVPGRTLQWNLDGKRIPKALVNRAIRDLMKVRHV